MIIFSFIMEAKLVVFFTLACFCSVCADTPANCSYSDIQGHWIISESKRGYNNTLSGCDSSETVYIYKKKITLSFPNVVSDEFNNKGFWTLVYNQGFEVVITGRKFFFFSAYNGSKSYCHKTQEGWSHTVAGMDWACAKGEKIPSASYNHEVSPILYKDNARRFYKNIEADKSQKYRPNPDYVNAINKAQSSWKAGHYKEYEGMTLNDLHLQAGGPKSKIAGIPQPKAPTLSAEDKKRLVSLPESFDWRNVGGQNFVTPVRSQGQCGSCYAFSSMGMLEARLKVITNNTKSTVFSPQDVVECCEYSQGCEGGFPFLIAGKYAEDFGVVEEKCNSYSGVQLECPTNLTCAKSRQYAFHYGYVGGYYGACNEEEMKLALMRGPLSVLFETYSDFFHYTGGIYHHLEGLEDKFNPFEITSHAVLLVGYGTDSAAGPYWIVKNSWGEKWGENGYFRIRRGADECSIESLALESYPVV